MRVKISKRSHIKRGFFVFLEASSIDRALENALDR